VLAEYKTVLEEAVAEYTEKKSKFIATVKPINKEEDAIKIISDMRTKYWDATHNVFCYTVREETCIQRFSDDGEPSGTAGMPMLEVVRRMEIDNIVVVVTRYFGGTLLGAAGLIRAYSKSTSLCLQQASIIRKILCTEFLVIVEYYLYGSLKRMIESNGYFIERVNYGQDVELHVFVNVAFENAFEAKVIENTDDRAILVAAQKKYITVDENGKIIEEDVS
jgi:uncharacterized YigZ family protein